LNDVIAFFRLVGILVDAYLVNPVIVSTASNALANHSKEVVQIATDLKGLAVYTNNLFVISNSPNVRECSVWRTLRFPSPFGRVLDSKDLQFAMNLLLVILAVLDLDLDQADVRLRLVELGMFEPIAFRAGPISLRPKGYGIFNDSGADAGLEASL
jgi:hypothetical protein